MDIINYEDIVEAALLDGLKSKFNINDNATLIKYLFSRCALLHGSDSIKDDAQFMSFLLQELCIPYIDSESSRRAIAVHVNGEDVVIDSEFSTQNSLLNIFESISRVFAIREYANKKGEFLGPNAYIKAILSDIQRRTTLKLKPYKNSHYKSELQTLFKLQCLNEDFCIKAPDEAPLCPMFVQRDSRISIETLYERYLHAENFNTTNVHSITEATVRDYLYIHLELIEDGLKPIMKEYPTKEGRVDIVAKDKDGKLAVIELKTENDKRLIWQCMYYPDEVKNGLGAYENDKEVRMITVAPEYPEHIKKPLDSLGYVESFTYTIKAFNGAIEEIDVKKCAKSKADAKKEESNIDVAIQKNIDNLISAFVYTKEKLEEKCGDTVKAKDVDDVALRLVEMAMRNSENR